MVIKWNIESCCIKGKSASSSLMACYLSFVVWPGRKSKKLKLLSLQRNEKQKAEMVCCCNQNALTRCRPFSLYMPCTTTILKLSVMHFHCAPMTTHIVLVLPMYSI